MTFSRAVLLVCALTFAPALAAAQGAEAVKKGEALYAVHKCASCHSIDGKGNTRYPLDGVGAKLSAEDLRTWIVAPAQMEAKLPAPPKMRMRAYPKLEKADLDALVAYMQSLK